MSIQKVPSNDAQHEFQFVMDQVLTGLGPVLITGLRGNAVLVSEADWIDMQKKLQRLAAAEMTDSLPEPLVQTEEALAEGDRL